MLRILTALFTCMLALPALADTQAYPTPVQAVVNELDAMCREVEAKPAPSPDLILRTDVNNDGIQDYLINEGAYVCDGAASMVGGSGGFQVEIFASHGSEFKKVFYGGTHSVKLGSETPPKVWLGVGGPRCGHYDAKSNANMRTCTRALVWDVTTQSLEFEPLSKAIFFSGAQK